VDGCSMSNIGCCVGDGKKYWFLEIQMVREPTV
jgi:hypothetical protein